MSIATEVVNDGSSLFGTPGGAVAVLSVLVMQVINFFKSKKAITAAEEAAAGVGAPNGKGPANRILETIVGQLDSVVANQTVQALAHKALAVEVKTLAGRVEEVGGDLATKLDTAAKEVAERLAAEAAKP